MAYRRRISGLHGQLRHRPSRRGKLAKIASRRAFRKLIRKPKIVAVKAYANTVGQIAYKRGSLRPSHGRYGLRRRFKRRY